jgi:hypothetical protein
MNETIANLKEKEIRLGMTLVMNGWDHMLVDGDAGDNALEFTGIEMWAHDRTCTFHTNLIGSSGSFSAATFDRFLSEACVKPTHVFGHPQAIQEMLSSYFALGTQSLIYTTGERVTPGFNFAGFVRTAVGTLTCVADTNFTVTDIGAPAGGSYTAVLYTMRMSHNGEPLVYRLTQIPLSLRDLTPGCTAISFEIWTKTALIIKHCCAHGAYTGFFTGRTVTTYPVIG